MNRKPTRLRTAPLAAASPLLLIPLIILIALIPLIAGGAPLLAGEGPHGHPFAGGGGILDEGRMERIAEHQAERLTRALDLTAVQQTTLARLQTELETTVRPLAESTRVAHEQLRTQLDTDSPDPAAVGALVIAIDRARDSMRAGWQRFETAFTATLSDSQRAAYRVLQEARPDRGPLGEHRGPGWDGGPQRPGEHPRH